MEESAKRRERLKAMRREADESGAYVGTENSTGESHSHGLTNPLIETSPAQASRVASPRFDFYTDPMAAFSTEKRRSKDIQQVPPYHHTPPRPRNPDFTPPTYHAQANYSHNHMTFQQARGPHPSAGLLRSPVDMPGSFAASNEISPSFWGGSRNLMNSFPSNLSGGNFSGPAFARGGSPSPDYQQGRGQMFHSNSYSSSGNFSSPSPVQGRGRGQRLHNNSPYQNSGRGRGQLPGNSSSPASGYRGGVGWGNSVSAESRPDRYYSKSMVEDPWRLLEPIIWKKVKVAAEGLYTPKSHKSPWFSKSTGSKKARVLDNQNNSSQPSLAEYLAASFNEAVQEDGADDNPDL